MCRHRSVSLNNEKICREFSEDKIAVCEKTAGLRSGNISDSNSACSKVLVPVQNFHFQDMGNQNRFLCTFRGNSKRPMKNSQTSKIFEVSLTKKIFIHGGRKQRQTTKIRNSNCMTLSTALPNTHCCI